MKIIFVLSILAASLTSLSQQGSPISAVEKDALIDSVSTNLQRYYVFPEKAKVMAEYLRKRSAANAYSSISNYKSFTDSIARDLQRVHKDGHMSLAFDPAQVTNLREWMSRPRPTAEMIDRMRAADRKNNFGFVKVERLPGNIGYLDLTGFFQVNEESKATVAAAMGFISNTDAVIIDLRNNGGGSPDMVQEIMSYFFDKPVLYNHIYERVTDRTRDFSTLESVHGRKIPNVDLYVLTSRGTFSAAEEFAYNLKNLKRAVIVGDTTGGGAHPTRSYVINEQVVMRIPFARSINAISKTNWEGVGVLPDVAVRTDLALVKAQQLIIEKGLANTTNPEEKKLLAWNLFEKNATLNPFRPDQKIIKEYAGVYGDRSITFENGELAYQRGEQPKRKLTALTENVFKVEGVDYLRMQFVKNSAGQIDKLIALYDDGRTVEALKISKPF